MASPQRLQAPVAVREAAGKAWAASSTIHKPSARGPGSNCLGIHHEPADVDGNCSDHRRLGRNRRRQTTGSQARNLPRGVGEIHVQRHGIAVHENRNGAQVPDNFPGRREGHGRDENARSRRQLQRLYGEVQRCGARVHRNGMASSDRGGKLLLEPLHTRPGRQPARAEGGDDLLDLALPDRGPEEGYFHFDHHSLKFGHRRDAPRRGGESVSVADRHSDSRVSECWSNLDSSTGRDGGGAT